MWKNVHFSPNPHGYTLLSALATCKKNEEPYNKTMSDTRHHHQRKTSFLSFSSSPYWDITQFILLLALMFWFAGKSVANIGYHWQWQRIPRYLFVATDSGYAAGPLLQGLLVTLKISSVSLVFTFCIGLFTAILRLSDSFVGRFLSTLYLEISRNTPLLIQIFFIYFVLGPALGLERMFSAILALSLFEGAYTSEIFRSGIQAVDRGQREAGASLGLSSFEIYRHIILPQAIRTILPPLTNQAISLVKDSSLVSTIAIYDLTMRAQALVAESYLTFEIWFTVALIYLAINVTLSCTVNIMEKHLKLP